MPPTRGDLRTRFVAIVKPFLQSEARWRAFGLLALLLVFMFCLNGLNVLASFMGGNFMTAVEQAPKTHETNKVVTFALLWAGLFGALTVVAVFKAFTEERLRLSWRQWLTRHLFERYLAGRAYYRMKGRADVDNPDQRITEDVRTFTEQTLAIFLIITMSTITLLSFSGVLWSITPWLLLAAVLYTLFGSVMTVCLGRRLMKLDVRQFKKEADLRYDLIQVRNHAEQIALLGGEREEEGWLRRGLASVVENMKGIIGLSRNINFFCTGFNYLIQIIPLLIVAPLYVRGQAEFGKMLQAQIAFDQVMGAFALIVKEFQRISTFGAVTERLGTFCEVMDEETDPGADLQGPRPEAGGLASAPPIEVVEDGDRVAFEGLTLTTPREGRLLVRDLTLEIPKGERLLVLGPSGSGRTSVLRAAAGLWKAGMGRVVRPALEHMQFLPQKPYLRSGCLREQLRYGTRRADVPDAEILAVLKQVGFEAVLRRVGGLDAERDWPNTLSGGEQQQVAFARLLLANPRFAFLDEATSALDPEASRALYETLWHTPITYVSVASDPSLAEYHDRVIELGGPGGTWRAQTEVLAASA